MGLIRSLLTLAFVVAFVYVGAFVQLGDRTLFQHVARIWKTDETKELVDGVKETSEPMVERLRRGFRAGLEEARRDGDGGPAPDADAEGAETPAP